MNDFVEQHLVALLRPTAQHVRSLQGALAGLQDDVVAQGALFGGAQAKLNSHEHSLASLGEELARVNLRVSDVRAEAIAEVRKELGLDDAEQKVKVEEQLRILHSRVMALQLAWQGADGSINRLQKEAADVAAFQARAEQTLATLGSQAEAQQHAHLGLSERLEITRRQLQDFGRDLQRQGHDLMALGKETRAGFSRTDRHMELLEAKFADCNLGVRDNKSRLASLTGDMTSTLEDVKALKAELMEDRTGQEQHVLSQNAQRQQQAQDAAEQRKQVRNVRQTLELLCGRVESSMQDIQRLLESVSGAEKTVQELCCRVDEHAGSLASHERDLGRLDKDLLEQSKWGKTLVEHGGQLELLKARSEQAVAALATLDDFSAHAAGKLDSQGLCLKELGEWRSSCSARLDGADERVRELSSEVAVTSSAAAKTALGIDMAHEFLAGVSRGFQGAHERVIRGADELLPYKKGPPRSLPQLPGPPPKASAPELAATATAGGSGGGGTAAAAAVRLPPRS
eukprot:TRINITY_DN38541_c0_g1_i1.p1 TRINITY_DN38541_c0_g1~~TRINITY_DN38541_c0_g1_i1.p1  ORF type:complete len:513 (+),score=148.56 TRINITY_DN38541_c0_g1_i1:229-1767(+)